MLATGQTMASPCSLTPLTDRVMTRFGSAAGASDVMQTFFPNIPVAAQTSFLVSVNTLAAAPDPCRAPRMHRALWPEWMGYYFR